MPSIALKSSVLLLVLVTSSLLLADDKTKDSVDRDYSKELPRVAAIEPDDAIETFTVTDGFRIEQVAAEPLVTDPIAMAFDENGRLFVIEMRGYSENEKDFLGQVRLLEDTDEDGKFDKSTVYADGLSWPTAIMCWAGGIYVGAAPDIFYFKDTDGDGKADVRQVVFRGFGRSNVQGLLNTFKWGMDNRIHGATSSSGGNVQAVKISIKGIDENKTRDSQLTLRGRDFAFDPRTQKIEATSGGGQHGLSFDQWGNKFVCSNSNHIQFVSFEDRYVARNPYFAAPSPRMMIAADGPQADVFRTSPVEPWRIVRTRLRKKGIVPGPVEGGGTAAGYFTGSTGITIYRGDVWPEKFYGWAIVGDVGSNLVHRKRLDRKGIGFTAHRVDEKSEFVSSTDIWFRPVQFANAPDGALYIADMYREVIEHPKSLHPVIKKHLDLNSGRDRGRIYRIVPKGFKQRSLPRLGDATTAELVATLDHKNGWHRETAARLLFERQDRSAIVALEDLAAKAQLSEGKIWAMYVLDGLNALSAETILLRLEDRHPRTREHAVRLAERFSSGSPQIANKLYSMVTDEDLRVRYQLAFTLGEFRGVQRNAALAELLQNNPTDASLRLAVRSSLAIGCGNVLTSLLANTNYRDNPAGRQTVKELTAQIGRQQRPEDVVSIIGILSSLSEEEGEFAKIVVTSLAAKQGSNLQKQLASATGGRADELIVELVKEAARHATDKTLDSKKRAESIHQLRLGQFDKLRSTIELLLEPTEPAEVQAAALDAVSAFDSKNVAITLVRRWTGLSPSIRRRAADVLFSRDTWTKMLLEQVVEQKIKIGDLQPGRLQLLATHSDAEIQRLAKTILKENAKLWDRSEVLAEYQGALALEGDPTRGKIVFQKTCAACHRVEDIGHQIGPNLAAMRNRGSEAILLNVLNPSREINPQYLNYVVTTSDGRSLAGMIAAETATSITLRRAENQTDTVLRVDIEEMRSTGQSLMPVGLEKKINKQAMADLIEYLRSLD